MTEALAPVRLDDAEIALYRSFIGRQALSSQRLEIESLRRYAAAVGGDPAAVTTAIPPLGHWAYFLTAATNDGLGPDGHPLRGGFLPPVRLSRRMFAGGKLRFVESIQPGEPASLTMVITDVRHRTGKAGDLILLDVERRLTQADRLRVEERQTIVYLNAGGRIAPVVAADIAPPDDVVATRLWQPNEVDLFRFSAVTFNAHRIHFDRRYTCDIELYPDLVVHGPFTAAKLFQLAQDISCGSEFEFKAVAPLFVGQPIQLLARRAPGGLALQAVRCDGTVAMEAKSAE